MLSLFQLLFALFVRLFHPIYLDEGSSSPSTSEISIFNTSLFTSHYFGPVLLFCPDTSYYEHATQTSTIKDTKHITSIKRIMGQLCCICHLKVVTNPRPQGLDPTSAAVWPRKGSSAGRFRFSVQSQGAPSSTSHQSIFCISCHKPALQTIETWILTLVFSNKSKWKKSVAKSDVCCTVSVERSREKSFNIA